MVWGRGSGGIDQSGTLLKARQGGQMLNPNYLVKAPPSNGDDRDLGGSF